MDFADLRAQTDHGRQPPAPLVSAIVSTYNDERFIRGRFLANTNTDDRLHPQAYERMAAVLNAHPDVGLVYCDCLQTTVENETYETTSSTQRYANSQDHCLYDLLRYWYVGPFPMWRRSLHDEIGYFDENLMSAGDYEFWIRAACRTKLTHLRETLGLFLSRTSSLSHLQTGAEESQVVIKRARRSVPLQAVFPDLVSSSDPAAETAQALSRASVDSALAARFQQLQQELEADDTRVPFLVPVQHPVVESARRKLGMDPADVPPRLAGSADQVPRIPEMSVCA